MRIFATLIFLAAFVCAQSTPAAPQSNQDIATANSLQARQILDKCIAALGGDLYLNIKDYEQVGRGYGFYRGEPAGIGTPYWRFYRYPDKDRVELTQKRDIIVIHSGDQGYEITFRGAKPEVATDHAAYERRRRYALDYVLREWIKEPGVAFFYENTTIVGPKTAHQVTIMNAQNQGVTLFIDANSYLPVKKSYSWRDEKYKDMNTEQELYDEYRVEQGIQTPHVITRIFNGEMQSQRFITTVKYNEGLSDSLFTPPALIYDKTKK